MKRVILSSIFLLCGALPLPHALHAEEVPVVLTITADSNVKVFYSFDHYANNSKMARTYVSEEMLQAAKNSNMLQSNVWDVSGVISRLTSLLALHTHSRSTTTSVRKDMERVSAKKEYERVMHSQWDDKEIAVYVHRTHGKNISELLIFKFRSNYCSRIIQLTGKLRTTDIAAIIRMNENKY